MCVSASRSHLGRGNPPEERYHVLWLFSFLNQHSMPYVSGLDLEKDGGPGRSRTADQQFRKPLLYPTELRGHPARLAGINWQTTENSYEDSEHLYSSEI